MWRWTIPIPHVLWQKQAQSLAKKAGAGLRFMTDEHHLVRDFVVRGLPTAGGPLTPECIAEAVQLPVDRVNAILDQLESHLIFLFRNEQGAVTWAYPVTADSTPHHATFSSGETVNAA
jgi:hypothetical protein